MSSGEFWYRNSPVENKGKYSRRKVLTIGAAVSGAAAASSISFARPSNKSTPERIVPPEIELREQLTRCYAEVNVHNAGEHPDVFHDGLAIPNTYSTEIDTSDDSLLPKTPGKPVVLYSAHSPNNLLNKEPEHLVQVRVADLVHKTISNKKNALLDIKYPWEADNSLSYECTTNLAKIIIDTQNSLNFQNDVYISAEEWQHLHNFKVLFDSIDIPRKPILLFTLKNKEQKKQFFEEKLPEVSHWPSIGVSMQYGLVELLTNDELSKLQEMHSFFFTFRDTLEAAKDAYKTAQKLGIDNSDGGWKYRPVFTTDSPLLWNNLGKKAA